MQAGDELRDVAVQRLRRRRAFGTQVATYLAVNSVLWGIWLVVGVIDEFSFPWPIFPTAAWGIALLLQAAEVHGQEPISEGEIQAETSRLQRS